MASGTWMSFKGSLVLLTGFGDTPWREGKLMSPSSLRLLQKPVRGAAPWPGWVRVPKFLPDHCVLTVLSTLKCVHWDHSKTDEKHR